MDHTQAQSLEDIWEYECLFPLLKVMASAVSEIWTVPKFNLLKISENMSACFQTRYI